MGDPLMVTVLEAKDPDTPAGRPEKVAPVAPVVVSVMGVIAAFRQTVRFWPAAIVFSGVTVTTAFAVLVQPVAVTVPVTI